MVMWRLCGGDVSERGRQEGGKWFHPTPLMGQSGFGGRGNEHGGSAPHVQGMGGNTIVPRALNIGWKGGTI